MRNKYFTNLLFPQSPAQVWKITSSSLNGAVGECQPVLLGRCLEFHFNNGIMKIGVMQMHKGIAIGKCVHVLYSCYAWLKKKENRSETEYLLSASATASVSSGLNLNISLVALFTWSRSEEREEKKIISGDQCVAVLSGINTWTARSRCLPHCFLLNYVSFCSDSAWVFFSPPSDLFSQRNFCIDATCSRPYWNFPQDSLNWTLLPKSVGVVSWIYQGIWILQRWGLEWISKENQRSMEEKKKLCPSQTTSHLD